MSEFYIKSINPSIFTRRGANGLEQMVQVTISSFKGRSNVELTADYDGAVIGKERINLNIGDNIIDFFIEESPVPRKIIFTLFYKGFQAGYHEADVPPPKRCFQEQAK